MSDPVVLYGTQSNGETLPVQVDEFGRLVAEGLPGPNGQQGEKGDKGDPGEQGPPGPGIELPPDPYEGALLGWLNGGLAWIGTEPIPIPEDVFGPILEWDGNSVLKCSEVIPPEISNGVYIVQVDQLGNPSMPAAFTQGVWSSMVVPEPRSQDPATNIFNGLDNNKGCIPVYPVDGGTGRATFQTSVFTSGFVRIDGFVYGSPPSPLMINGEVAALGENVPITGGAVSVEWSATDGFNYTKVTGIYVNGKPLIDQGIDLTARVGQRIDDYTLVIVPNISVPYTFEQYLRPTSQRVAPWVLYGNDPTSLIDHLRRS